MRRLALCVALILLAVLLPAGAQEVTVMPPLIVEARLDMAYAYQGQMVVYTLTAYSDTERESESIMPPFEGFWQAERRVLSGSATLNGKQYSTRIYQVYLYPQAVGPLEIPPARVEFTGTVFVDGASLTSNSVVLDVIPLPWRGEPFSGLVGGVSARFQATPMVLQIGQPIDVELHLQGVANLMQFSAPELILPDGWRAYPEPRENHATVDGGVMVQTRVLRWRAIPDRAGRASLTIPAITYFLPSDGYLTLDVPAIEFEILPAADGALSREVLVRDTESRLQSASAQQAIEAVPVGLWLIAPTVFGLICGAAVLIKQARIRRAAVRRETAFARAVARLRTAAAMDDGLALVESAVTDYFRDYGVPLSRFPELTPVMIEVEAAQYYPDGAVMSPQLARQAAELLHQIESRLRDA